MCPARLVGRIGLLSSSPGFHAAAPFRFCVRRVCWSWSRLNRMSSMAPLHHLFHFFHALQNLAGLGFPLPGHAHIPPTEKIPAFLACCWILVHGEERYSGFLQ